jgi:hypothetical protein
MHNFGFSYLLIYKKLSIGLFILKKVSKSEFMKH